MLKIYDNDGKTIDRYTVIIDSYIFGMSRNPLSVQGFNQYCGQKSGIENKKALGKEIDLNSLNDEVKEAILVRYRGVKYAKNNR